ncbi:MAG: binding-protein-dependent transport system inner rane component [Bryobacterales bacterium]|nr:binding-protein-dependent transport system inner rane component [Bryobacterales bacterium]
MLVRYAPGFGVDERELDARFSQETIRRLREESGAVGQGIVSYYLHYVARALTGDLGVSTGFQRPVAALIAERFPKTLCSVGAGLACGWTAGMLLALAGVAIAHPGFDFLTGAATALLLCVPSAVMAFAFVLAGKLETGSAAAMVIALVILPRVFRYARSILGRIASAPYVFMALARGTGRLRLIWVHVLRPAWPSLFALLAVSVSMALGAAIPVEVICDSPGLGHLAWQAALKRDLPLLIDITLLISLVTGVSGFAADLAQPSAATRDSS